MITHTSGSVDINAYLYRQGSKVAAGPKAAGPKAAAAGSTAAGPKAAGPKAAVAGSTAAAAGPKSAEEELAG